MIPSHMKLTGVAMMLFLKFWFRYFSRLSPDSSAGLLARLFSTPQRSRTLSGEAVALLSRAEKGEIDGVAGPVCVYRWRQAGPRVLLVHDWSDSAGGLAVLIEFLLANGYDVTAADMPAHGESAGKTASLREWVMALRLISRSAGRWDCVIGHSFGGLAAATAVREDIPQYGAAINTHRLVLIACPDKARDMLGGLAASVGAPSNITVRAEALLGQRLRMAFQYFSTSRAVRHYKGQLMGIHDTEDMVIPLSDFASIHSSNPLAERLITNGLGHIRIVRDEQVIESIINFLKNGQRILAASPSR